ncbi:hypothetical protein JCGZ_15256 [Jatropha curcas]|uniref:Uncharacterized protein n=1 Tax=Jatropha curcas TaxID=180498 RepID=A0A067K336_JATCU|nr:hypothetical protein JCGZ_15256 [Jatropha curcas]
MGDPSDESFQADYDRETHQGGSSDSKEETQRAVYYLGEVADVPVVPGYSLRGESAIDSERAPVVALTETRFFRSFMRMLGLSIEEAKELVVDDWVNLAGLIEQYLDALDFVDLEFRRFRTQAVVFCLVSACVLTSSVSCGDLRLADLVLQMEQGVRIVTMALAKTILSLDPAYRVDGVWSGSPILLQVSILKLA